MSAYIGRGANYQCSYRCSRVLKIGFVKECVQSSYPDLFDFADNPHDLAWTVFVYKLEARSRGAALGRSDLHSGNSG